MDKFERSSLTLKTLDSQELAATLYSPRPLAAASLKGGVLFLHMMPATKESWDGLAANLADNGYLGLAIDLRGHGASSGGPRGYAKFEDAEHQKSILDLDAAAKFLMVKGLSAGQIAFVGASIGANLSLRYLVDHPEFKTAVLLSPGLNYRGLKGEESAAALQAGARVLIVSSKDDIRKGERGANEEAEMIYGALPAGVIKGLQVYDAGGHGTELLSAHSELKDIILAFLAD
jgi:pimeloyl-ACP methyl ester carboxylesterase